VIQEKGFRCIRQEFEPVAPGCEHSTRRTAESALSSAAYSPKHVNQPTFRALSIRGVILLGLLGIVTLSIDESSAQQPVQPPAQSATTDPAKSSAAAWEKRHAEGIAIDSPFPMEEGPDVLQGAPEKIRDTLASVKTFKSGSDKEGFRISVTIIVYKPGVPVDLETATKSVTERIKAFSGDKDDNFVITPAKISGLDARESQFHGTALNGKPFYAALTVVQQGQKLWQVQAVSMNEAAVPNLVRAMNSITIEPAP
jgi:hypothetical protein